MPIKDYPFFYFEKKSKEIIIGNDKSRPFLWIRVFDLNKNDSIYVPALIDTGSSDILFPASCAARLGHNLKSVKPKTIGTANGTIKVYPHKSNIEILDILPDGWPNKDKVLFSLKRQPIDYTEDLKTFLLGQNNFLNNFILRIDYPKKRFSVRFPFFRKR